MTQNVFLGLDIGTQAVKGVLVTSDGDVLSSASLERGPQHPHQGWAEMDAEKDWWDAGVTVIRKLLAGSGTDAKAISAVGITALACCLCPLDASGVPLRSAIIYSDNRAIAELEWVNHVSGLSLSAEAVVPKLVWIRQHEPEVFSKIKVILSANNYVVYRLTGRQTMDYDNASIMGGIFEAKNRTWNTERLRLLELPTSIWPELLPATGIAGKVSDAAAQATGLVSGTPVIAGTGDTFPTIVGCGAVCSGDAMVSFGTTGLLTLANRPLVEAVEGPHFSSVLGEGAVTWGANVLSAGRLLKWFRDQFAGQELVVAERMGISEYDLLEKEAERVAPGAEGLIVLPHLLGRRTPTANPVLRGAILGLTPSHTAAHIYRAMLEAFAFNVRQGFDVIRPNVRRLIATAGGARSTLWKQIVASVLETPLTYHANGSGPLGIAYIAAYALGLLQSFDEINTRWLRFPETTAPVSEWVEVYRRVYPVYGAFDEALVKPFSGLASLSNMTI